MALDLYIVGADGKTRFDSVGIEVDEHRALVQRANPKSNFPLIHRLADYYADASFTYFEIAALKAELALIDPQGMDRTIASLLTLLDEAEASGRGIEAIAD